MHPSVHSSYIKQPRHGNSLSAHQQIIGLRGHINIYSNTYICATYMLVHTCVLINIKKNIAIYSTMDRPREYHPKWSKSENMFFILLANIIFHPSPPLHCWVWYHEAESEFSSEFLLWSLVPFSLGLAHLQKQMSPKSICNDDRFVCVYLWFLFVYCYFLIFDHEIDYLGLDFFSERIVIVWPQSLKLFSG